MNDTAQRLPPSRVWANVVKPFYRKFVSLFSSHVEHNTTMPRFWLDFEKEMLENLVLERDALIVLAKGLGLQKLLSHFLHMHCSPTNLVLCIGATECAEHYISMLHAQGVESHALPKVHDFHLCITT
jgi:hypothetical protein